MFVGDVVRGKRAERVATTLAEISGEFKNVVSYVL